MLEHLVHLRNYVELFLQVLFEGVPFFEEEEVACVADRRAAHAIVALHGEPLLLAARRLGRVSALSCGATEFVFLRIIMYYFVNALKF